MKNLINSFKIGNELKQEEEEEEAPAKKSSSANVNIYKNAFYARGATQQSQVFN